MRRSKPRPTPSSSWKTISTGGSPPPVVDKFLAALPARGGARLIWKPRPRRRRNWFCRRHLRRSGWHAGEQRRARAALLPGFRAAGAIQESWRWLGSWETLDDVVAALAAALPQLAAVTRAAPSADFRMAGAKVPREPHRYSGRTAMLANISVHEPKPPDDPDSPLSFSMEGNPDQPPSALLPFFWSPGWNSIQAVNKFQAEIGGPLRQGDPGVRLIEPGRNRVQLLRATASGRSKRGRTNGWWFRSITSSAPRN